MRHADLIRGKPIDPLWASQRSTLLFPLGPRQDSTRLGVDPLDAWTAREAGDRRLRAFRLERRVSVKQAQLRHGGPAEGKPGWSN